MSKVPVKSSAYRRHCLISGVVDFGGLVSATGSAEASNLDEKMFIVCRIKTLDFLRSPPGNRLEALKGNRAGQYSIRVNDQFRVCFVWSDSGLVDVEIVDYH